MEGVHSNNQTSPASDSCRFWDFDDISQCARAQVINYQVPLVLAVLLVLTVSYNVCTRFYRYDILKQPKAKTLDQIVVEQNLEHMPTGQGSENEPLLINNDMDGSNTSTYHTSRKLQTAESLKDRHFSIEHLKLVNLNGEPHGKPIIIKRDIVEKFRSIVEFILVLTQFTIHSIILLKFNDKSLNEVPDFSTRDNLVQFVQWSILLSLIIIRLININQNIKWINKYTGNLWILSFLSYLILFFSQILPFRSILINHIKQDILKRYYLAQFWIDTSLFLLLFLAPIKGKFSILYKTDESITPSPEPITSFAGFICWSWLDKFVWKANKQIIEKKDVWGLTIEDYSIFVLKKFKTYSNKFINSNRSFTFKLLTFFTNHLILQGFWACLASFTSFIPTLLLKRILEYVEDQSTAPANLAWFYVMSMFFCKIVVAIANGQALFFGRRVCIRMKSIIVSEIYSKALRKRINTSNNENKKDADDGNEAKESIEDPQDKNDKEKINGDEESTSNAKLGTIINLMAIDAFKISEICAYLHSFVEAIVMTIIALTLLYRLIGFSAIIGTIVIVLMLPVNFKLASLLGKLQKQSLAVTDKRIQKLNEAFQAIRIIKFFSWEDNFQKDINVIRENELQILIKRTLVWNLSGFVWFITPTLVTTASFAYYIYIEGKALTTPVAFTALSLFSLLRDPLDRLSDMLSFVIQSKVSLDRVSDFLNEADTDKYNQLTIDPKGNKLAFENTTVAWDKEESTFKLRNLDIDFKIGKLNVVIGPTGSGKTSLLMALLGEMHLLDGNIVVPALDARQDLVSDKNGLTNSIAYCSQAAWLLNDTVRNNILFNTPYNEKRYKEVVKACGLKRDFEILKAGDMTEIGEKGITLSGGQKQRVSLARALYSDSRHLLLDDCLSAVDSHTASWIYDNCITGPLMEGRTCILVSHNIALTLKNAELVVMLENGKVKNQGTPMNLLDSGLLGEDELVKSSIMSRNTSMASIANLKNTTSASQSEAIKKDTNNKSNVPENSVNEDDRERAEDGKLIEEEAKAEGVVSLDVYKWYLRIFGGLKIVLVMASIFVLAQLSNVAQSWWVRNWAANHTLNEVTSFMKTMFPYRGHANTRVTQFAPFNSVDNTIALHSLKNNSSISIQSTDNSSSGHSTLYYLSIYFLLGLAQSTFGILKTFFTYMYGIKASRRIFKKLLKQILHAKLRFFDTTPIGRIMNRFSKDIESTDQDLTPYLHGAFYSLVECVTTVILITYITPQFISIAILISFLYYAVGYFYMAGSRELKRLDSITKSPIYQHFSETLVGVTTIRAYGDESRFLQENLHKIDENNKPFFYLWVANRWLSFRIDLIGALVVFGAGVFILSDIKNIDAGLAGISLTYAISFTDGALWLVRFYSEVEMNMNSVERLMEYMGIEQEPYEVGNTEIVQTPPVEWPQDGKIEVNDLSLRYAPNLPRVIKNVSFTVDPSTKIGVVGRTGAGKSTIITALFRFLDPETGYIKIDNFDITSIDLSRLRHAITIIPQDPTLFAGTIKTNLDPYDEYSDEKIFAALRRVNLVSEEELIQQDEQNSSNNNNNNNHAQEETNNVNRFLKLDNEIAEGGSNLSQGQRQLVCLARSLLRSPKILLLDEATASIDYDSDAKVQTTIRQEFADSTILTIAHRLRSVIDYDKILVMDAGEVKEYDHPYSLLLDKKSLFYSMCEHSGELETLIELAKEAFVKKLNSA